jgi:hypothetical protein
MKKIIGIATLVAFVTGTGFFVYQSKNSKSPIVVKEGELKDGTTTVGSNRSHNNPDRAASQDEALPLNTSEKSFPKTGEAWVYKIERPASKDAERKTVQAKNDEVDIEEEDNNTIDSDTETASSDKPKEKFFSKDLKRIPCSEPNANI